MKQIALFVGGTFLFTWTFHLLIPVLGLPWGSAAANRLYEIGLAGPLVAALLVTALFAGAQGIRKLLATGARWRFHPGWYAAAVLVVGAIYAGAAGLNALVTGRAFAVSFNVPSDVLWIVLGQVWVVIREEYGWRGLLQPLLVDRLGSLGGPLLLGLVWAAWHLPMFFVPGSNQTGSFFWYAVSLICWSIFMTVLVHRTGGSTLIAMLFHAAANFWFFTLHIPRGSYPFWLALHVAGAVLALPLLPRPLFRANALQVGSRAV